jgi:hypothetical protein
MEKYKPKQKIYRIKQRLGVTNYGDTVYLSGFSWDCDWYWGGGYLGNRNLHTHFDGCFLKSPDSRGHSLGNFYDPWTKLPDYLGEEDVKRLNNGAAVWENLDFFLSDCPEHLVKNWWRIKDLYKQFYTLRDAAGVFQYGGHCTGAGRNPDETNIWQANLINCHIETVIIPEIMKALGVDK